MYVQSTCRFLRQATVTYYVITKFVAWLFWQSFLDYINWPDEDSLDPWQRTRDRDQPNQEH
jgi:hypothetical protein